MKRIIKSVCFLNAYNALRVMSEFLGKKISYLISGKMKLRPPFEIYFFIIFRIQIPFLKLRFGFSSIKRMP